GAQRHLDDAVLAATAAALVGPAALAVLGDHVLGVAQVQEGPELRIGAQDHMASAPAIAAIRPAFRHVFLATQMPAARTAFTGTALDTDLVDEVRGGHGRGARWSVG